MLTGYTNNQVQFFLLLRKAVIKELFFDLRERYKKIGSRLLIHVSTFFIRNENNNVIPRTTVTMNFHTIVCCSKVVFTITIRANRL